MLKIKCLNLLLFIGLLILVFIPSIYADRGLFPIADVNVYGPGQKAIIAWNGEVERLILSTDLYANVETKVLEVLPLPSKPNVEKGDFKSFETVQNLMIKKNPRVNKREVEVVFHEKIGAHDITIVEATSFDELNRFIMNYLRKMNASNAISMQENAKMLLEDYLNRGFNYWVFDLVDLRSTVESVEPIVYEFRSSTLYYPMKISATVKGESEITLYLITQEPIDENIIPSKMYIARYFLSEQPIQFQLSIQDLAEIDEEMLWLFGDKIPIWFTVIKYKGNLSELDFDVEIPSHSSRCRMIKVSVDKPQLTLGESVKITVEFIHLLPGCYEIQVLHFHQIRLEAVNSLGVTVESWRWETNMNLQKTFVWKPDKADNYTIKASSWWNGEILEVENSVSVKVIEKTSIIPLTSTELQWLHIGAGLAILCILLSAFLSYALLKSKAKKNTVIFKKLVKLKQEIPIYPTKCKQLL